MSRLLIPALVAAAFALSASPAHAQVYVSPGYAAQGIGNGYGSSFHAYGVPNGGLHRTLGNGVSVYPYYNFGGYRSTFYTPSYAPTYGPVVSGYSYQSYGGRRGWRR